MTNINSVAIAATIAKDIDMLRNCNAVAYIERSDIPESYLFIEDTIIGNYRVSIYNMNLIGKPSYMLDIKYLGKFQIM